MHKETIALDVEELPNNNIENGQLFNITSNNVSYLTHNIHKYPAKFIPQIPRWAIKKYLKEDNKLVLDPFCGSGTTLVESLLTSNNCVGLDVDPLALMISKVKTTIIDSQELLKTKDNLIKELNIPREEVFRPKLHTLEHWFNEKAIKDLGLLRNLIDEYKDNKDIYDFLMVTFSSIIRKVSNADDQSQKTYVSHTNIKNPPLVIPTFIKRLEMYIDRLILFSNSVNKNNHASILKKDARDFNLTWEDYNLNEIDLGVTSPPYIKAVDYIYNQMAEYFWIGDIFNLETQKKQNVYKKKYVGTKQVKAEVYRKKLPKTRIDKIDDLVFKISEKDTKHAYIVAKFFVDMEKNFEAVYSLLKEDSHYIMVIGNNSVNGYYVPSHEFLIECAKKAGFKYSNHFGYNIRNRYMRFPRKGRGGLIKEDWVLDFVKE